jgi:hypothetical protein
MVEQSSSRRLFMAVAGRIATTIASTHDVRPMREEA